MPRILVVVGLGYVGLPLAIKFAKHFSIIGYDINKDRIVELQKGFDKNNDVTNSEFKEVSKNINFTTDAKEIAKGDIVIISVPTPLKPNNNPDLSYLESASKTVGKHMKKGALIIYESTVYPGCTEEFCLPILEKESKMKLREFYLGYSPERMNPGDKEHTVDKITKLISASHPEALEKMKEIYSKITKTYAMSNIKAAEAAKIIENVQRDINMALFNELSMLFDKLGLDSEEVFAGAATKWNFIKFRPGLVGGYCIPVNPHYLAYKAALIGFHPELILAGRKTNENMPIFIAKKAVQVVGKSAKTLILGASYKENVAELRSSRVKNLVEALQKEGAKSISIYDPIIKEDSIFGLKNEEPREKFDLIIYAVAHDAFGKMDYSSWFSAHGYVIDIPKKLDRRTLEKQGFRYWAP
ncbi:nucleotide sugar dehydrogenase [Candidatus Micrarchaeota archaeon]|nr:nucleotide sugar dehydrogenase [Candidatus Micrarchaeota archaeon]